MWSYKMKQRQPLVTIKKTLWIKINIKQLNKQSLSSLALIKKVWKIAWIKQLATSKKQADDATKAQQARSASDSKAKTADTNKQQSGSTEATNGNSNNANVASNTQSTANNDVASGSNSYGGGSQNNYSQGGSNTSQNNTNSGSSNQGQGNSGQNNSNTNTNTGGNGSNTNNNGSNGGNNNNNQPQTRYVGWVSVDGVRRYSQTFNTLGEAQNYVDATVNSAEVINLGFEHSIRYGVEPA